MADDGLVALCGGIMTVVLAAGATVAIDALKDPTLAVPLFAVLFLASFVFSGTEIAYFSLQSLERQRLGSSDAPGDRQVEQLLQKRTELITTILMGNEFANVAIATTGAALLATFVEEPGFLNIVVITPALVLLSEITPKVLALRFNQRWARAIVWPLTVFYTVLSPLRWVLSSIVSLLARLFGVSDEAVPDALKEEDFLVLVERGEESGAVGAEEREIIEAVLEFDDVPVSRLMTPRLDIEAVELDTRWEDLYACCEQQRFSRVPVFEGELDNIVGVLLVKDLLRVHRRPPEALRQLSDRLLQPMIVPPSLSGEDLMRTLLRRRVHMAFVVNEHGTLMGLVTLDDLIGELIGAVADDQREVTQDIAFDPLGMRVRAGMDIEDLEDETGIKIPPGEYHTIGGFVVHELGRMPTSGEIVEIPGVAIEVLETDGNRITEVRIQHLDQPEGVPE